jgi:hypothetical protein
MPTKPGGCTDPSASRRDDLIAWARGEATPGALQHIGSCPACGASAAAYADLDGILRRRYFRSSCPASTTIGEYSLGMLPASESIQLASHLVECPHCRTESRELSAFLSAPDEPLPERGILGAARRLLARPLAPPELALAALRGAADEQTTTYEANGLRLTVSVQVGRPGRKELVIVGLVQHDTELPDGAAARLYIADRLIQDEPIDAFGNFLFAGVSAGDYRIEVSVPDAIVEIDALHVS